MAGESKRCVRCGADKPRTEFHRNHKAKDGLASSCRPCISAYQKDYYTRHKREFSKRYSLRSPFWVSLMTRNAMLRARKLGLKFERAAVEACLRAAPDRCPALGIELVAAGGPSNESSPTLDRIKPELGYVKGNVQVLSMRANAIKNDASPEEVMRVARFLAKL